MTTAKNHLVFTESGTGIEVWMKRLDLQFGQAMGNKVYKSHYNFQEASSLGYDTLLTFGGAYSNHIAAVSKMGMDRGFKTIGVIRGAELGADLNKTFKENPTLRLAKKNGMQFDFVTRHAYRQKDSPQFREQLRQKYDRFYILPEGGTNGLAVKGCEEILGPSDRDFDVLCCPVGTGGTIAGLINSASDEQKIVGYGALKADLSSQIALFTRHQNWQVFPEEHFGGFAKIKPALVSFINRFKAEYNILLDPIYTGKMMYSLIGDLKSGLFKKNIRILAIHTGGLQGIPGMNNRLEKKGFSLIKV